MSYIKDPKSICSTCKHRELHWDKLKTYPSSCKATKVTDPVTGASVNAKLCQEKNKDGSCPDYVEDKSYIGCLIFVIGLIAFVVFSIAVNF